MIRVVAALAEREGRVLLALRPPGKAHAGLWEFPGGKVEVGEADAAALARELREELGVGATVGRLAGRQQADGLELRLYEVALHGEPHALEAQALGWFTWEEVRRLPLPPVDRALAGRLCTDRARL